MSILEYVSIDTTKKTDEKANHMGGFILTMGLSPKSIGHRLSEFIRPSEINILQSIEKTTINDLKRSIQKM